MKNTRKLRKSVCTAVVLIVILIVLLLTAMAVQKKRKNAVGQTVSIETTPTTAPVDNEVTATGAGEYGLTDQDVQDMSEELKANYDINKDVKAILTFPSGLLKDPVLQSTDNTYYLYKDWKTGEDLSYGSITLDYENDLTDENQMNTIIYGHYIYEYRNEDRSLVFTPLAQLKEESSYEANKYVALITTDEIRYYEIARVFDCPMEDVEGGQAAAENFQFNLVEYDEDYFKTYLNSISKVEYYDTGVELNYGDKLLTLQTCIEEHPESREIVLCKEIDRRKLD